MSLLTDMFGIDDQEWMSDPSRPCAGKPDEDTKPSRRAFGLEVDANWHPDGAVAEDRAKSSCDGCPAEIKTKCLQFALDNDEESGIWGGLTRAERVELVRGNVA